MPRAKPTNTSGPVEPPRLVPGLAPAPTELEDRDEWIEVATEGDYVGGQADELEMRRVHVTKGRWSGVTLGDFRATDVVFENCDLAGFVLQGNCSLLRVRFSGCRMSDAVLAGASMKDVRFESCVMTEANLRMIETERVEFDECQLTGADLYSSKLSGVRFARCDLIGVDITKAELVAADLRTSRLEGLRGAPALRGAIVDSTQVLALAHTLAVAMDMRVIDDD